MHRQTGIVWNGHLRAYRAWKPIVRAEVQAEYAERLERAGFWERLRLRLEMKFEIDRRIQEKAPSDALY
jgi:hypothetical protein